MYAAYPAGMVTLRKWVKTLSFYLASKAGVAIVSSTANYVTELVYSVYEKNMGIDIKKLRCM